MASRPHDATATTTSSSVTGRKSSRPALRRVAAASIGHSTTHPPRTKSSSVAVIPVRPPSAGTVPSPTARPITAPRATAPHSRGTASRGNQVLMRHDPSPGDGPRPGGSDAYGPFVRAPALLSGTG